MNSKPNTFDMRDRSGSRDSRSNSKDSRSNSKDSRTWSFGSIESIAIDDEEVPYNHDKFVYNNENSSFTHQGTNNYIPKKRRKREINLTIRRDSPNPIYWNKLLGSILKMQVRDTK